MKEFLLGSIRFYQKYLSFDTGVLKYLLNERRVCRFDPRCSEYTYQAVVKHGTISGLYLGFRRVLRCHPWAAGGVDPVP